MSMGHYVAVVGGKVDGVTTIFGTSRVVADYFTKFVVPATLWPVEPVK